MFKTSNDSTEVFVVKLIEVESRRKRLIAVSPTETEKQEMAQCFFTVPLLFQVPILFAVVFSSFRLILSAFGWEQVEYHTKLMNTGLWI